MVDVIGGTYNVESMHKQFVKSAQLCNKFCTYKMEFVAGIEPTGHLPQIAPVITAVSPAVGLVFVYTQMP